MPLPRKVTFVCTGNQCRSAAAAAILAQKVRALGLPVEVDSAGTLGSSGMPAQPPTMEAAAERGYDLSAHRSRTVEAALLESSDAVLAMARSHEAWLLGQPMAVAGRVSLFKPYCLGAAPTGTKEDEIPDPVGQPLPLHRACVTEIERLLDILVARWQAEAEAVRTA